MYKSKLNNMFKILINLPAWWITKLPSKIFFFIKDIFSSSFKRFGVKFLLRNIFKPLFGFKSRVDHLVSILVRIGHFVIISVSSLLQAVVFSSLAIVVFLSPFIAIYGLLGKIELIDLPNYLYSFLFVINIAIYLKYKDTELTKDLNVRYKDPKQNLEIILKNCDANLLGFIKKTNNLMTDEQFTSRELLAWIIAEKEILELFNFLEIVPVYKEKHEKTKENLSYKKILSEAFVLAYNNNLPKLTLKEILLIISKYNEASEFLKEFNLQHKDIEDIIDYFYKKKIASLELEKNKKESLLRITSNMNRGMTGKLTPTVEALTSDLTSHANKLAENNFIGREKELNLLINVLKENNSPLIVGNPGIGKTSLIEYLGLKMATSDVPKFLQDKRLVLLNTSALIAGDNDNNDNAANKLVTIINEISSAEHIILVIDEISNLVGIKGSNSEANFDLFSQLSQFVNRKEFQVIATTTEENFNKYLSNDVSNYRAFQKLNMKEETENKILKILIFKIAQLEKRYKRKFSYKSLKQAYEISNRFIHDYSNPAKSISILEEALLKFNDNNLITSEDINKVLKEKYNINLTKLSQDEADNLVNLEDKIHQDIIGQNIAVKSISSALRKARLDIRDNDAPIASFLFLGPTGVGKTELAKTTARIFFGEKESFIRIDMSEYPDKNSIYRLLGHSNNSEYVPGLLTDKTRSNPFSLILFDEIEKAHPDVLNIFLQLLDDGRLTDGRGKTVDFKNCIIIATSNVGNEFIQESFKKGLRIQDIQKTMKNDILPKKFRLEFINRFSKIITFTALSGNEKSEVVNLLLDNMKNKLSVKNIKLIFDEQIVKFIAEKTYNDLYGARNIKNLIKEVVDDLVSKEILSNGLGENNLEVKLEENHFLEFI